MQSDKQGQRNDFSPNVVTKNVTSLYPRWSDGIQSSIDCPGRNNSGFRTVNDYFAENKHHENPVYP